MNRRHFLTTTVAATLATPALAAFEVQRSTAEWKAMLSDLEFAVMREAATEEPFTSPLNDIEAPGIFHCKGCDQALYDSADKFESGTGWPSFTKPLENAIETEEDRSFLFLVRTECHCDRCGSHLGHIFDDGPAPTGKRHCLNGVALVFKPD